MCVVLLHLSSHENSGSHADRTSPAAQHLNSTAFGKASCLIVLRDGLQINFIPAFSISALCLPTKSLSFFSYTKTSFFSLIHMLSLRMCGARATFPARVAVAVVHANSTMRKEELVNEPFWHLAVRMKAG